VSDPGRPISGSLDVELRPGTSADAEELADAMVRAFELYRPFAPPGWSLAPQAVERTRLAEQLAKPRGWCLVARSGGALAGHSSFVAAAAHSRPVQDPELAHLTALFVEPSHWGTGLATVLHGAALRAAAERGFSEMRLFTPTGQARARRFYEREGWTAWGPPELDEAFGLELVEYRRRLA